MYGVFVRVLAERSQRKAFLQARNCIEDRLRLEDENEKQVSAVGISSARAQQARWGGVPGAGSMGWGGGARRGEHRVRNPGQGAQSGEDKVGDQGTERGTQGGEEAWRGEYRAG